MTYLQIFEAVEAHLRSRGYKVRFNVGEPLRDETVADARAALSIPLPPSLVEFYKEMGDGMRFGWHTELEDGTFAEREPFANVEFAPLAEVVAEHERRKSFLVEYVDDYEYDGVDDPELAKRTAQRMRHWLVFHEEGNGDSFCLDTSVEPSPVVFNQHDWMDGGTGENGLPMAKTLKEFIEAWSRVCFQFPSSLWWPSVLRDGQVDWDGGQFREPRFVSR